MKQSTSKRIKIIAIIFLSLIILVSLLNICDFFFIPKSSDTAVLNKSIKLHGNENCYYIGNDFYVTDSTRGFVQIFDSYGSFKTGYSFPTNGGTAWFGAKNNTLYCYCVRTDTLFTISDSNIINQQTAYYANPEAFASDNELSNNQQIKINNNVATLHKCKHNYIAFNLLCYITFCLLNFNTYNFRSIL